jgi:hypothetical protein
LAADCQALRPGLLKGFQAHEAAVAIGPGLHVGWSWHARQGIANLVTGPSPEVIREFAGLRSQDTIGVGHDGLFLDWRLPWLTTRDRAPVGGVRPLALNLDLVARLHDRLRVLHDRRGGPPASGTRDHPAA